MNEAIAPPPYRRLSVNLVSKSATAVDQLMELTGLSQTDVVNRAVQVYLFFEETEKAGGQVLVKEPDGEVNRVKLV